MNCPFCGRPDSKVVDSRPAEEGTSIRRRRECQTCTKRFTTYETVERLPLIVIKKDGAREAFDKNKLINGLLRACDKRSVTLADLETLAGDVQMAMDNSLEREVTSEQIGELVIDKLKKLDDVAYVRFASVYRQFKDINSFKTELEKILTEK